jgi:hypothetical protein
MTAPLIAPLIPPRARPGVRERGRAAPARHLPMAAALEVPAVPGDVVYGTGRIDESGRVADRAMTGVLGWAAGRPADLHRRRGRGHRPPGAGRDGHHAGQAVPGDPGRAAAPPRAAAR